MMTTFWDFLWKLLTLILLPLLGLSQLTGCSANQMVNDVLDRVGPRVDAAAENLNARTGTATGSVQAVRLGLSGNVDVFFGQCVKVHWDVYLEGMGGQLSGTVQGDNEATVAPDAPKPVVVP